MEKNNQSTKEIGNLGEKLAQKYLIEQGFTIIAVNYWRKWGEIDIIAQKADLIHFVEVKTVSYETKRELEKAIVSGDWRPEEQVTDRKLHQIGKAIQTWIPDNKYEGEFAIDVLAVRLVPGVEYATVNFIENVVK
jgi:putative endonuclease